MFLAVHVYSPSSLSLVLLFRRVQQPFTPNLFGSGWLSAFSQVMLGSGDPLGLMQSTSVLSFSMTYIVLFSRETSPKTVEKGLLQVNCHVR